MKPDSIESNRMPYINKQIRISYQRTRRNKFRKLGLCTRCGGPRDNSFIDCENCRKSSNKLVRKIVKRNLKDGKCRCGKKVLKQKLVCKRCSDNSKRICAEWKKKVINGYGGMCACCKEKHKEFLSADHVNNDGAKLRRERGKKEIGVSLYRRLVKEKFPPEYQILCFNCNMSLAFFGFCPHRPEIKREVIR